MNAPLLPPESSFSKASVSETSPRTLSENVEFSPNLSPNLFVYFSSFLLLLFLRLLLKRKCLWSAWFCWLILPLKAVEKERVETGIARCCCGCCWLREEEWEEEKEKEDMMNGVITLLLFFFFFLNAQNVHAQKCGCLRLCCCSLSRWKWKKNF